MYVQKQQTSKSEGVNPTVQATPSEISEEAGDIQVAIDSLMNSNGFVQGEKTTGTGDMTRRESITLLKKSSFNSNYFQRITPYSVIRWGSYGGAAGGSYVSIIEPEQKEKTGNYNFELNKVDSFNPWNAGSDITGGVNPFDYELINDHALLVTFKVEKDVSIPNANDKCIKRGKYTASYSLDKVKHIYLPTGKKDALVEDVCLDRGQG